MKKDIKLLYVNDLDDRTYRGFGSKNSGIVRGIETLLQKISKILLTVMGSDLYSPNYGSNLQIFLSYGPQQEQEISSYISMAVSQTEDLIVTEQLDKDLDDSERLIDLTLQAVNKVNANDWEIEVFVQTAKNETYLLKV
jgi:phage baseplate assembly protein W